MCFRQFLLFLVGLNVMTCCLPARGDEQAAEEFLKSQGLRKLNQYFVLSDDAVVAKRFREIDALRKKTADVQQKAAAAEQKVDQKKQLILDYAAKRRMLRAQIDVAKGFEARNRLINMQNELVDRSIILEQSDREEKDATAARAAANAATEQYIELLLKIRKQYDQIEEKYEQLAGDAKIQQALDELGKSGGKPFKLGPTGSFALLDRNLKRFEAGVLSESISLRRGQGNLWYVTVTFNGKRAQEMAIDTGASVIALPNNVAAKAGLTPTSQDPTVRMSLADGSVIEAKMVIAKSVRVGKFTVEHVECAVMPGDLPGAEPLLGLSFLKHFTFKIDNERGKLVMFKFDQPEKGGQRVARRSESRRQPAHGPREGKSGDDQPPAEAPPAAEQKPETAEQQIVQLLKTGEDESQGQLTLQKPGGESVSYLRCKQGPIDSLNKRFGAPDEVTKLQLTRMEGGQEVQFVWKVWSWGKVRILVDEKGKTQYYRMAKE
jgi:clan AA aspartic protease (TIGR02281 family)